jgi:hypothetical protein
MSIKKFNSFNESISSDSFYNLFGKLVYIDNVDMFGDQYEVSYTNDKGIKDTYISDREDLKNDFKSTSDTFEMKSKPKRKSLGGTLNYADFKPKTKLVNRYNIVYFVGKKRIETIRYDLDKKTANGLRKYFSNDDKYQLGDVKLEIIK